VSTSAQTLVFSKSLQTGGHTLVKAGLVTTSSSNTLMTSRPHVITTAGGKPMVAKVLTNAQGQLISMESLLAHQKQQLAAAGATSKFFPHLTLNIALS
jgi:bifunctional N-acetylglucosamine-1-phosphate-uridyltransferase/glucosamine-1-phosphate-acetyltransferase GlmU-like protein